MVTKSGKLSTGADIERELVVFSDRIRQKFSSTVRGNAEEQLRAPVERLLSECLSLLGFDPNVTGELPLANQLGRPDYGLLINGVLVGYVELKAPGVPVTPGSFRGRDKEQFSRFSQLPNVLYSNGTQWVLYRSGTAAHGVIEFDGGVHEVGRAAINAAASTAFSELLRAFASWAPIPPRSAPELASALAPLCHLLRTEVLDSLARENSPLVALAVSWRQLLFPEATDFQFADAYAQTITFALLLARAEGADTHDLNASIRKLESHHSLLSRALVVLTDTQIRSEIDTALRLIQVTTRAVSPDLLKAKKSDPWLYFYEDFLEAYDPELRRQAGVYYTPSELVSAQAALVEDILINRMSLPKGFATPSVRVLDPALGTGTYLLKVLDLAAARIESDEGEGAVAGYLPGLRENLIGFELMVGPYAVAELRLTRAFLAYGGSLASGAPRTYLTDALESPHAEPADLPLFLKPISQQHEAALRVKEHESVVVCIGNPPYDYHKGEAEERGGWVVNGDGHPETAIFQSFLQPVLDAGLGVHAKHLYDSYVFFWRWAMWKVLENRSSAPAGVVAFVTASSFVTGKAFVGFREHMRHRCDEIWVIDLGGGSRGARKSQNVFAIRSAVAICIAVRYSGHQGQNAARVHYAKIEGTAKEKLKRLGEIGGLHDLSWADAATDWHASFRPAGVSDFFDWPAITDLLPWHTSGVQFKRTWPIGPTPEVLADRWAKFLQAPDRAVAFKESRDRKIVKNYTDFNKSPLRPLATLSRSDPVPQISRYGYRSFDRQWAIVDNRLADYARAALWRSAGPRQVFLASLLTKELGEGPAATVSAYVPDMDHFCNRGARDIIPKWKDEAGKVPNVCTGLLGRLSERLGRAVTHDGLFSYVYGITGTSWYTDRFEAELTLAQIRIPITANPDLFWEIRRRGEHLIWLHTFAERQEGPGRAKSRVPTGQARCTKAIPNAPEEYPEEFSYDEAQEILTIGGGKIGPVSKTVWDFSISDFRVVQSWIGYRLRVRRGKKTSPLDRIPPVSWTAQMTRELLEVLWVLEATLHASDEMWPLLDAVVEGELVGADNLPSPTEQDKNAILDEEPTDLFPEGNE